MNRRVKQILAIIGIVIIAGLYIATLILALIGSEQTKPLFMASAICTILVPVVLYILSWLYKLLKGDVEEASKNADPEDPDKK